MNDPDDAPLSQRRRRFGRGPATSGPALAGRSRAELDAILEHEIVIIERALADRGELARKDLAEATGSKYWGSGRFGAALRAALDQGRVRKAGRGRYAV